MTFIKGLILPKKIWVAKKKQENKDAIRRFKEKNEPDKFYAGGIAPLVGEPSYAAHFYDDRTPYFAGTLAKKGLKKLLKKKKPKVKKDEVIVEEYVLDQKTGKTTTQENIYKKADKNRPPTADEIEDYMDELPHGGELDVYDFGHTIDELDKAVTEHKAYMADMKSQYMRGDLDKYVKPEVLEEQRLFRQKKIDNVLDKAYDEVFYQKPVSGDYKYDADVLADSIAEQLGKGSLDDLPVTYQNQIRNSALNRVQQIQQMKRTLKDVDQKMQISDFDPKDRLPNYLGGRVSYSGGGKAGLPAITQETQTPQMNMQGPQMPAPAPQPAGISGANFGQNQMDLMQHQMNQNPWQQQMQQGKGGMQNPQYKGQFRMPFGLGGMSRRAFIKLMGMGAALPFMPKAITKLAPKAVPKVVETVASSNASGMPVWFPKLVERVIKEGDDVTKTAGTVERQTVHRATTPEGTPIEVTQDLTTGSTFVDIGEQTKHGWSSGRHGQPTRLVLNKGEWIEPTKGKPGVKTKDEFFVEEAEFTGGHPENIKFEDVSIENYGDHASDFTEIEKFAVGKNTDKKIIGKKARSDAEAEIYAESRAEGQLDDIDPDAFASGGIARLLGE